MVTVQSDTESDHPLQPPGGIGLLASAVHAPLIVGYLQLAVTIGGTEHDACLSGIGVAFDVGLRSARPAGNRRGGLSHI